MNRSPTITINPKVLKWAREGSGYSTLEIARKLNIDENQYVEWERQGADVAFIALKEISSLYKFQIATFFLPEVPKHPKRPTDYRNIDLIDSKLSKDTLLAIRKTNSLREFLNELNGNNYYANKYNWLSDTESKTSNGSLESNDITNWIRQKLSYSIQDQIKDKRFEDSYLNWRNSLENLLGLYVFQFRMPRHEIQGFCYSDSFPFCIVINSKYPVSSRIFTLFHELGHILKRQSGLCVPDNVTNDQLLELECNSFAGRVLLPDDVVVPSTNQEEIFKLANRFKVSSEVYLRRLKSLDLVSNDEFFPLLDEIRRSVKPRKKGGLLTPIQRSVSSRGQALFNSVIDALNKNRISYERASEILEIKINHLLGS